MASSITVAGKGESEAMGQRALGPQTTSNSLDSGVTLGGPLVQGDNTFPVPSVSTEVAIYSTGTASPAATLTIRTSLNSGDVGLPFNPQSIFKYPLPSPPPASIIIHATQAQSSPFLYLWFN